MVETRSDGAPQGARVAGSDESVHERIDAEILRGLKPGLLVLDLAVRKILFSNERARGTLEVLGSDGSFESIERLFRPSAQEGERQAIRAGNRLVGFSVYGEGPTRWIFCRDITDIVRQETVEAAAQAAAVYGDVFSTIRHEVGNPLNSAKTALAVLQRNFDRFGRETQLAYVDRALRELSRVEALLHLLKAFFAHVSVEVERLDVARLLSEVAVAVGPDLEEQGIVLEVVAGDDAREVLADGRALQQVLLALVANAASALRGRPKRLIRIHGSRTRPGLVRLQVEDSGRGMAREILHNVFTPLFGSEPGRVGVGLATARALLARMDGTIEVESEEGVGTTVTVTLRAP